MRRQVPRIPTPMVKAATMFDKARSSRPLRRPKVNGGPEVDRLIHGPLQSALRPKIPNARVSHRPQKCGSRLMWPRRFRPMKNLARGEARPN